MDVANVPKDWKRVVEYLGQDGAGGLIYQYADGTEVRVTKRELRDYLNMPEPEVL